MKIFKFFITKIFLRNFILGISMILMTFFANYTTFTALRSIFSTLQGYREMAHMNQDGTFIANLDPDSEIDFDVIGDNGTQAVYDYLNRNFNYALYTDGFMISLPNIDDMEISLAYMNERYWELNPLELSQGMGINFDYHFDPENEIPVLVGKGISKAYPLGSAIEIRDPVLGKTVVLKVKGILKQNVCHSNFYALNSKNYYNFSIVLPVNEEFIKNANIDLQLNALMDMILLNTTKDKASELSSFIQENLGIKFHFFSQEENFDFFEEYYIYSLKIISITTLLMLFVITCLSVWNALVSVRLMQKDFTINLLVGLSYARLKKIFYSYLGIVFFINLLVIFTITAFQRYSCWIRKDTTFITYGLFGLIGMDWFALFSVFLSDIVIGKILAESMLKRIKKVPISLGVLQ